MLHLRPLHTLCQVIPTKRRSYRDHRFCDVDSAYVNKDVGNVPLTEIALCPFHACSSLRCGQTESGGDRPWRCRPGRTRIKWSDQLRLNSTTRARPDQHGLCRRPVRTQRSFSETRAAKKSVRVWSGPCSGI